MDFVEIVVADIDGEAAEVVSEELEAAGIPISWQKGLFLARRRGNGNGPAEF